MSSWIETGFWLGICMICIGMAQLNTHFALYLSPLLDKKRVFAVTMVLMLDSGWTHSFFALN